MYKSSLHCQQIPGFTQSSFELRLIELNSSTPVLLALIYRPPKYKNFIQDFENFLSNIVSIYDKCLILGDMNIHVCCRDKPMVKEFLSLIDSFELTHTLNLVLTYGLFVSINEICNSACFSDHFLFCFLSRFPSLLLILVHQFISSGL